MKVRVKGSQGAWAGYYGHFRRRAGDILTLTDPKHFSESWMEKVDESSEDTRPAAVKKFGIKAKPKSEPETISQADPSQSVI